MRQITDAARDALLGRTGTREVAFRFDILRNGIKRGEISGSGSITLDFESSIQRTAQLSLQQEIDWLKDTIKPYMLLKLADGSWESFPLGVFIPASPQKQVEENGQKRWEVACYESTIILREDCLTDTVFYAAGTKYLSVIEGLLAGAGVENILVQDALDIGFEVAREFESGTQKLEIINTLLDEVNFNKLRCDADGNFVLSHYREPTASQIGISYRTDDLSVIRCDGNITTDYLSIPNIFIVEFSNPEFESGLRAQYINDQPDSPVSTINRGRRVVKKLDPPDMVSSQADLDDFVARKAFEASQVFETITFYTALMPVHESGDIISISHPEFSGIYQEIGWEMNLEAGAEMKHVARKLAAYG